MNLKKKDDSATIFAGLIFKELLLEPNLLNEFGIPGAITEFTKAFSQPISTLLASFVKGKTGLPIPPRALQEMIEWLGKNKNTMIAARATADIIATVKSPYEKYNSCCRSAICHASISSYDNAFGALRVAASVNNDWSRHHHIYGLIHGAKNSLKEAEYELQCAFSVEPFFEARCRIEHALSLLNLQV
jgi:hypothetical protein